MNEVIFDTKAPAPAPAPAPALAAPTSYVHQWSWQQTFPGTRHHIRVVA
jgi:hypothetical protein